MFKEAIFCTKEIGKLFESKPVKQETLKNNQQKLHEKRNVGRKDKKVMNSVSKSWRRKMHIYYVEKGENLFFEKL